jgi:hypothetical protein
MTATARVISEFSDLVDIVVVGDIGRLLDAEYGVTCIAVVGAGVTEKVK